MSRQAVLCRLARRQRRHFYVRADQHWQGTEAAAMARLSNAPGTAAIAALPICTRRPEAHAGTRTGRRRTDAHAADLSPILAAQLMKARHVHATATMSTCRMTQLSGPAVH